MPPDPLGEIVCRGWDNRGVAIGEGRVFVSQLNGDQVAVPEVKVAQDPAQKTSPTQAQVERRQARQ